MRNKAVIASLVLSILAIGLFTVNAQNSYSTNSNNVEYTKRSVYDEKEDGWVYGFEIVYVTKDSSINYIFDGYNLKHRPSGTEYYVSYKDEEGNEIERIPSKYATLSTSEKYRDDIKKINEFFNENKFEQIISLNDLSELDITEIKKEYLVDLFNRTINSKIKTSAGNYLDIPSLDWKVQTSTDENYPGEWQVMYIMDYGLWIYSGC